LLSQKRKEKRVRALTFCFGKEWASRRGTAKGKEREPISAVRSKTDLVPKKKSLLWSNRRERELFPHREKKGKGRTHYVRAGGNFIRETDFQEKRRGKEKKGVQQ